MHQGGYKVDIDFLGKCLSERKRSVSVKKKKDSANHKNELRLEKKLTDPWEKKGENHFSLCQPEGNSLAAKGRTRSGARVPFGSGVPPRFYLRTMGSDQLGEPRTVHR